MKTLNNTITLLVILATSNIVQAQFWENNAIYGGLGGQYGTYKGTVADINYNYKQKYSLQVSYASGSRESSNIPADYINESKPMDNVGSIEFLLGRIYKLDKSGAIRTNIKIGLAANNIQYATNYVWHETSTNFWTGKVTNYTYDNKKINNIGFIINPSIEFVLLRGMGISVAPHININAHRTSYGGQIELNFGILRPRLKKKLD